MWVTSRDNLEPLVAIGQIEEIDGEIHAVRDLFHNFQAFDLSGNTRQYVGTYSHGGAISVVSVSADRFMAALPEAPDGIHYLASLVFDNFSPEDGVTRFQKTVPVCYDTILTQALAYYRLADGNLYHLADAFAYYLLAPELALSGVYRNIWRLTNSNNLLTVGFESGPNIHSPGQIQNIFGDAPDSSYYDLFQCQGTLSVTQVPLNFPVNAMTLIQFPLADEVEINETPTVLYTMPLGRVRNVPIFANTGPANQLSSLFTSNRYFLEFFGSLPPTSGATVEYCRFSLDGSEYQAYMDYSGYSCLENVVNSTWMGESRLRFAEDGARLENEIPSEDNTCNFTIQDNWTSGMAHYYEFFEGEIGRTVSGYNRDGTKVHAFTYLGHNSFEVNSY
jgi:hypothetical protein